MCLQHLYLLFEDGLSNVVVFIHLSFRRPMREIEHPSRSEFRDIAWIATPALVSA
jgi:hypothetical protein